MSQHEVEQEDRIFVAVAADIKHGMSTLLWAMHNLAKDGAKVIVAHVHWPAQMISMMGAKVHYTRMNPQQANEHRNKERENALKKLDGYVKLCTRLQVRCEKIIIESDEVAKGLEELITLHGITKLVIGAAADKHYSKKMRTPQSKTSHRLMKTAAASCKIWFTCKGQLICTREANTSVPDIPASLAQTVTPTSSPSSISSLMGSSMGSPKEELSRLRTTSSQGAGCTTYGAIESSQLIAEGRVTTRTTASPLNSFDLLGMRSENSGQNLSGHDGDDSIIGSPIRHPVNQFCDCCLSYPCQELENPGVDAENARLEEAIRKRQEAKKEVDEETTKRKNTEDRLQSAHQLIIEAQRFQENEIRMRQTVEETLRRQTKELQDAAEQNLILVERINEMESALKDQEEKLVASKYLLDVLQADKEKLQQERDACETEVKELRQEKEIFTRQTKELHDAEEQNLILVERITEIESALTDQEEKLVASKYLVDVLQADKEKLQQEREACETEVKELRQEKEIRFPVLDTPNTEFSVFELEQAIRSFDETLKIGDGGSGSVYRGSLGRMTVAIKLLHPQSTQGPAGFNRQVAVLSRLQHQNIVSLIGSCKEAFGLVYEFLPNGNLADRLACINNTPPLTWQMRTRIISDMCSALSFLHSNMAHPIVHSNLKPQNILFDANHISKLGDLGICRLQVQVQFNASNTTLNTPNWNVAYIDPEFLSTGELTPHSDVYSFGIITLQLLTGRPPQKIAEVVEDAMKKGELHLVLDHTAGIWPFMQANQLAHLGLRCAEMSRSRRPDLAEVSKVVDPLVKSASLTVGLPSFATSLDDPSVPSYFVCPIFQEVMSDPHFAADGFTYEAEAIRGWFDSGHNTSPMTNLKLRHCDLTPNKGLRSVILEWQQQHQQT